MCALRLSQCRRFSDLWAGEAYKGRLYGCGESRRDANKEFGLVVMGSFRGKPINDSDLRYNPELQQHEDFTLVLGEGCLDSLRWQQTEQNMPSWAHGTPETNPHYPYEGPATGWVHA